MKLYDNTIEKLKSLLETGSAVNLPVDTGDWPDVSDRSMILRSDMAYELGSNQDPGIGLTVITASKELVPESGVKLIGPDLGEISADRPYARIAVVRVDEETLGEGQALYSIIRDLENVRYHFYPEGFMMRISASRNRESVRVATAAIKKQLGFGITGSKMIEAFCRKKQVEAVQIYYVTDTAFDFKALEKCGKEVEKITQTIDHILKNVIMDCNACSLQQVCDEVEGLRELHFGK